MTINKYKDLHLKKFNFNEGEHNIRDYSKIHNIHKFYAKLIPQIPRFLINKYSKPGELVLDPFCGSGRTGVVAKTLGRRFVGVDIKFEYCLDSKVAIAKAGHQMKLPLS